VIEAKLFSELPKGTKNASFYVIAPVGQIIPTKNLISFTNKSHIKEMINKRIGEYYYSDKQIDLSWYLNNLNEVIDYMDIKLLNWESIISYIGDDSISDFYTKCLYYNKN
jgi:hypothetical protein